MTADDTSLVGQKIHFLRALSVALGVGPVASSEIFSRGSELILTDEILIASRDKLGVSWIEAELSKTESARIALGGFPEHLLPYEIGDADHEWRRKTAMAEAFSRPLGERDAAVAQARKKFGTSPSFDNSSTVYRRSPGERNGS